MVTLGAETQSEAQEICNKRGGVLPVLRDNEDIDFFKKIAVRYAYNDSIWMGMKSKSKTSEILDLYGNAIQFKDFKFIPSGKLSGNNIYFKNPPFGYVIDPKEQIPRQNIIYDRFLFFCNFTKRYEPTTYTSMIESTTYTPMIKSTTYTPPSTITPLNQEENVRNTIRIQMEKIKQEIINEIETKSIQVNSIVFQENIYDLFVTRIIVGFLFFFIMLSFIMVYNMYSRINSMEKFVQNLSTKQEKNYINNDNLIM